MTRWPDLDDMGSVKLARRATRRRWVALTALGYAGALVQTAIFGLGWWAALFMGVYAVGGMGATISTSNLGGRRERALDERQQAVRDRAYRLAYGTMQWVAMVVLVYLMYVIVNGRTVVPAGMEDMGRVLVIGTLLLIFFVPSAIIAWSEPDSTADGEGN